MQTIKTTADLKKAIQLLEQQQSAEWLLLKTEFRDTYESMKPLNIIRRSFKEVVTAPDLKTNAINAAIGLTSGIFVKKLLVGRTINPIKKLLGVILEVAVAGKVANNVDGIKSVGGKIIKKLFNQENGSVKV